MMPSAFVRRLDLTTLQLYVAVCDLGSINRAADREAIAASAVSKRLAELEGILNATLLTRHPRGVSLTPAGQTLLQHARATLLGLEKMQADLMEYADGLRGDVRLHANVSAVVQFLPTDLGRFTREHPSIKIELQEQLSLEVVRAVAEGLADLGVCNARALSLDVGLARQAYRRDRLSVVVRQESPLASRKEVAFSETLDFDHVGLHANSSIAVEMRQAAATAGKALRLRIQVNGLDAMCRMIANGLGVGVVPDGAFVLMAHRGELRAVPLTDPWANREIVLVARDFSALPPSASLLFEHLREAGAAASPLP